MPDETAPPPPPAAPSYAYQPPAGYQSPPPSSGVKLPSWLNLWDFIFLILILVGAILILAGFLSGDAGVAAETATPPSATTIQNDFEGFFIWTGVGAFLAILGWILREFIPPMMASRKAAAAAAPAMAAPSMGAPAAPAPSPAPAAPAPVQAAPATPLCSKCGKPTTYIAQYGRYYCYTDNLYV